MPNWHPIRREVTLFSILAIRSPWHRSCWFLMAPSKRCCSSLISNWMTSMSYQSSNLLRTQSLAVRQSIDDSIDLFYCCDASIATCSSNCVWTMLCSYCVRSQFDGILFERNGLGYTLRNVNFCRRIWLATAATLQICDWYSASSFLITLFFAETIVQLTDRFDFVLYRFSISSRSRRPYQTVKIVRKLIQTIEIK